MTKSGMCMNRLVIFLFVVLRLSLTDKAQKYLYQYITVKDGLPSNYVTSMFFDLNGVFWIGTDKGIAGTMEQIHKLLQQMKD